MRICLVYDCLYPHTVGGAERWYRSLAERLVADGHEVTYLTLRQWVAGADAGVDGVDVHAVGPRMALYTPSGRRRILPPLVFGLGVFAHLVRQRGRYDAIHTDSFPYFSVLAVAAARPRGRYSVTVDWFEVWSRDYWREYLGTVGGAIGWLVQGLCARVPQRAFCFSSLHAERLREVGLRGELTILSGLARLSTTDAAAAEPAEPETPAVVVYAGRHIPEKRVPAIVPAVARARETLPQLRATIIGDGPERDKVIQEVKRLGLRDVVDVPGFVTAAAVHSSLATALCLVLPSRREGYGLVVVEAAASGTPSIVVAEPDNAAVELIADGENGYVAASCSPDDLAAAIVRVHQGGSALRSATAAWFLRNVERLSLDSSLESVVKSYSDQPGVATSRDPMPDRDLS
jgi:glycosyltransferase involved in cell wall biosynthesis